jgi:flagellar biosynthesis protein FlhF
MAQIFATIGAQRLLPTRIDVARRLGSLLAASFEGGLAFTDFSATAKVADGLSKLTSKRLTQLLMPRAERASLQNAGKAG